jgi:hypothetical protein
MRTGVAVAAAVGVMLLSVVQAAEPVELRPLAFLVGEWDGTGNGRPGSGAGIATFSWSLQDRVMLRTSYAEYPAASGQPPVRHDDLMIIYAARGGVRADYFDDEGHVIHYGVRTPADGQAVFLSDAVTGEPTYRLTYKQVSDDVVDGTFEIADPGTTVFKPYLTWRSRKTAKPAL